MAEEQTQKELKELEEEIFAEDPSPPESPREERERTAREGDADYWIARAAAFQGQADAIIAVALLLRETRDVMREIAHTLEIIRGPA
jgi:hypothetical protein